MVSVVYEVNNDVSKELNSRKADVINALKGLPDTYVLRVSLC